MGLNKDKGQFLVRYSGFLEKLVRPRPPHQPTPSLDHQRVPRQERGAVDNFWAGVVGLDEIALLCMATPEFKIHAGAVSTLVYHSEDIRFHVGTSLEALARPAFDRIIRQMQAYGWVLTGTIKHAQLKSPDSFDPEDKRPTKCLWGRRPRPGPTQQLR